MLARAALKKDRLWLTIWTLGVAAGALICASNISSGYGDEAQRAAALQAAINSPVLLIGRGLPMGPGEGAFLFYTYGVIFATIFAIFGIIFAIRHGRAEEDDGTRELLRACATGRVAGLSAAFISGTIGTAVVAFGLVAGLIAGGADVAGSLRAGGVCASVGLLFIAVGALCGQLASTARLASGLGAGLVAMLFLVRVVADVNAEVDPLTLVADPGVWGWLTPFTLVQLANPYGSLDLAPVMAMIAVTVACGIVAALVEQRREFGVGSAGRMVRRRLCLSGPGHGLDHHLAGARSQSRPVAGGRASPRTHRCGVCGCSSIDQCIRLGRSRGRCGARRTGRTPRAACPGHRTVAFYAYSAGDHHRSEVGWCDHNGDCCRCTGWVGDRPLSKKGPQPVSNTSGKPGQTPDSVSAKGSQPVTSTSVRDYGDQLAGLLEEAGFPRMPARVLMTFVTSESGDLTADQIAQTLGISPAAVSGAIQYLRSTQLVRVGSLPATRRRIYTLNPAWYTVTLSRATMYGEIQELVREIPAELGPDTAAGKRVAEMADFYAYLARRFPEILEEWRELKNQERPSAS